MSRRFFMGSIPPVLHPSSAVLRAALASVALFFF